MRLGNFVENNLRKRQQLLGCLYNPHKLKIKSYFKMRYDSLSSNKYENFLPMDSFDTESIEKSMRNFMDLFRLKNLIRVPT